MHIQPNEFTMSATQRQPHLFPPGIDNESVLTPPWVSKQSVATLTAEAKAGQS